MGARRAAAGSAGRGRPAAMLLPGHVPGFIGPPTAFALKMRPWLLVALLSLVPIAVARFMALDPIGGLFLVLATAIGLYAVRSGMDIAWLLCLAVVLVLNAAFDAFAIITRVTHAKKPLLGAQVSWKVNVVNALLIVSPFVELVTGYLCWAIYREQVSSLSFASALDEADYGSLEGLGLAAAAAPGAPGAPTIWPPGIQAFHGKGYRLSD